MKASGSMPGWQSAEARRGPPRSQPSRMDRGELIVRAAFARFDVVALAVALGCVCALGLWAATAILLVKGAPPGTAVGPHLALLANFLPGYSVSWPGSFLGLFYGFLIGAVLGGLVAIVWNLVHHIYLVAAVTRRYFAGDL
jgi:hypothetical protein